MNISRIILRKMIVREVKNILTNPQTLYESDFVSKLTSGENIDSIMATIQKLGNDLDDIVIDSIKDNEETIKVAVSNLDEKKRDLLVDVLGILRGSLRSSTFTRLVTTMGLDNKF
jgi:hypothetical protein